MEELYTSNENTKKFQMKTGSIVVDDYKISQITGDNILNKQINVIFLDKIVC